MPKKLVSTYDFVDVIKTNKSDCPSNTSEDTNG